MYFVLRFDLGTFFKLHQLRLKFPNIIFAFRVTNDSKLNLKKHSTIPMIMDLLIDICTRACIKLNPKSAKPNPA